MNMKKLLKGIFLVVFFLFCGRVLLASYQEYKPGKKDLTLSSSPSLGDLDQRETYVNLLQEEASQDPDAEKIYQQKEVLPDKLLKLAACEKEARPFVLGFLEDNPSLALKSQDFSVESPLPYYAQWDRRWGYRAFSGGIMATHGCGPSSIAMVLEGLGIQVDPGDIASYIEKNGYLQDGYTSWKVIDGLVQDYSVQVTSIPVDQIPDQVNQGAYVVASLRRGNFTSTSHMVAIAGLDDQGRLIINDPNSVRNSKLHWQLPRIQSQIKNAWAIRK